MEPKSLKDFFVIVKIMKKKQVLILVVTTLSVTGLALIFLLQNKSSELRECPNNWIEDRMLGSEGDNPGRQYFIFDGERKEIKNYDLNWIKSNCSVQVEYVY